MKRRQHIFRDLVTSGQGNLISVDQLWQFFPFSKVDQSKWLESAVERRNLHSSSPISSSDQRSRAESRQENEENPPLICRSIIDYWLLILDYWSPIRAVFRSINIGIFFMLKLPLCTYLVVYKKWHFAWYFDTVPGIMNRSFGYPLYFEHLFISTHPCFSCTFPRIRALKREKKRRKGEVCEKSPLSPLNCLFSFLISLFNCFSRWLLVFSCTAFFMKCFHTVVTSSTLSWLNYDTSVSVIYTNSTWNSYSLHAWKRQLG